MPYFLKQPMRRLSRGSSLMPCGIVPERPGVHAAADIGVPACGVRQPKEDRWSHLQYAAYARRRSGRTPDINRMEVDALSWWPNPEGPIIGHLPLLLEF